MSIESTNVCDGVVIFASLDEAGSTNSYALGSPDDYILIDSMTNTAVTALIDSLEKHSYNPLGCRALIITHGHSDHFGGAAKLKAWANNCQVWAHPAAAFVIENHIECYQGTGSITHYDRPGTWGNFSAGAGDEVKVDQMLRDGDVIEVPILGSLSVHHMPGHERGLVTLFEKNRRLAIAGDIVQGGADAYGNWIGLVPDPEQHLKSLKRLQALNPLILCKGHRKPRIDANVGLDIAAALKRVNDVCDALEATLAKNSHLTLDLAIKEAFRIVLNFNIDEAPQYAIITINGYLCWLGRQGKAIKNTDMTWSLA